MIANGDILLRVRQTASLSAPFSLPLLHLSYCCLARSALPFVSMESLTIDDYHFVRVEYFGLKVIRREAGV
jgi:hypothetical protein